MVETNRIKVWTYDDYAQLPDYGSHRMELVEGELVLSPAPNIQHQRISGNFLFALRRYVDKHHLGELFDAPVDVVLSKTDTVQPDIIFIARENRDIITTANIQGAPDLAIEIISPSSDRLDRIRKSSLYARFGIAHYWIVDPILELVEEYALSGNEYRLLREWARAETMTPRALHGLEISLDEIFQKP